MRASGLPCRFATRPSHVLVTPMRPLVLIAAFVAPALSRQFVQRPGVVPGPALWSEVAVVHDVQRDGPWDVLFVNAQGYEEPGDFGAPSDQPLPPAPRSPSSS